MTDLRGTILVFGGARSGKSVYAESLFAPLPGPFLYLATGHASDDEMAERIDHHRARRGAQWRTIEEPCDIAPLVTADHAVQAILVDCVTLWLSNLMEAGRDIETETAYLCEHLAQAPVPVVLVSNEVGMGLVPETPLGRAFRDAQGRVNQRLAAVCDRVVFVAAGLPLVLKGGLPLVLKG